MALNVTASKPFTTNIPEDTYSAVCVGVFDLGSVHNKTWNKDEQKILFLWELPELRNPEGFNETIHQMYTASLGDKSNLKKMLVNWRGKAFTPAELESFDVKAVLGQPCQLLVIHNKVEANTYANIQNVSGWPKSAPRPKHQLPLMVFEFGVHTEVPYKTPEWIKARIESAPEWVAREDLVAAAKGVTTPDFGPPPTRPTTSHPASYDPGPGVNAAAVAAATSDTSVEDDDSPPF
jgi:hypothetical protein